MLVPVALGMAVGVSTAAPAGLLLSSEPFYLSPLEPRIYIGVLIVFLTVAATAALVPAVRALANDPIRALHHD